ncbi:MAG: hypothetical protein NTW29_14070 [Bacteroidetes bacterium]|nr:hypothetical protein [Bacteroidota bacterium]
MKTSSSFLWQLIHSLSGNEKLFFKRNFLPQGSPSTLYKKLFDAIAGQKEYDEAAILKKFQPELNKKNIAFQKHYLHQLLCNSLIEYDNRHDPAHDLYNQVQLVRIYRKKGLLDEAHNIWKKAVQKARKSESFAVLNLLKTEFEKMILVSSAHTSYDELHSLFKSNTISYPEYAGLITLRDIYTETILVKRIVHYDLDPAIKQKITGLLRQTELYSNAASSPSFWFRYYYFINKATLNYLLHKISESFELLKSLLDTWKKKLDFITSHTEHYVELLYMINYAGIHCGEYGFVLRAFNDPCNELITEPVQKANFEANKFLALNKIYNKTARYDEVNKLIHSMKTQFPQWEHLLNADLNRTVNISIGIGCFVLEQFEDALYYIKRAITYFRDGTRDEHLAVAQILLLLITYSMNNQRLFDAQYRNTYTYFYKRKRKHPFETALVQCLHRSFYMTDSKKKTEEYQKALLVFEKNKDDVVQQMAFAIFNYPGWLISKAQRIPYRRYVENTVHDKLKEPILE